VELKPDRRRPLAEYGWETQRKIGDDRPNNRQSRKTWTMKPLTFDTIPEAIERAKTKLADNPQFITELDRRGWERSLIFKIAVLTGLRRGEIESLTIGHLHLDEPLPFVSMKSQDTKNRQAVEIPLRGDLADDLRQWLEAKQEPRKGVLSLETKRKGLPLATPLFDVPKQMVKILDRDLIVADIPKADDRGRTVDFHSLRHTFGTLLSVGGVNPRTAQQAMRHSTINLTMNTYTDPRLLDVAGAVDALPMLPLPKEPKLKTTQENRATGTAGRESFVAPTVAPRAFKTGQNESLPDKTGTVGVMAENEKTPQKAMFLKGFERVTDGTRTHNPWNHNPVL
jgi:integrase